MKSFKDKLTAESGIQTCLRWLLAGAILVNIKSIFTDYDIDTGYAVVMSYRNLLGDHMLTQMWEPHQTSAFLTTFLMWCYYSIIGSWSSVVIFLHTVGVLLQGIMCMAVYKVLAKRINPVAVSLMCLFLSAFRPKGIVFPEFSNMAIGFSVFLFVCLLLFFEDQRKTRWLIAASVCLGLQVISYPSCLVVYFFVVATLVLYTDKKLINAVLFTVSCLIQGLAYILFFVHRVGLGGLISGMRNILEADSTHGNTMYGAALYLEFLFRGGQWLAACLLCTLLIESIVCIVEIRKNGKASIKKKVRNQFITIFSLTVFISEVVISLIYRDKFSYIVVFFVIMLFGVFGLRYCSLLEKQIYVVGMLLSSGCFLAVFLLTNLDILSVAAYLVLAVMVSFLPIARWIYVNKTMNVLLLFCAMVIMHRGLIVKTIDSVPSNIFDLQGIIRSGPAVGIVTCYMGAYEEACDIEDWDTYIVPGDTLLLVGNDALYAVPYMYKNVSVSAHSTISTPTYDEMLLKYWEENPEKFPNVIAVSCWYGELHIEEDSWIYQWIQEEFQPSTYNDGRYWRFYRLEESQ